MISNDLLSESDEISLIDLLVILVAHGKGILFLVVVALSISYFFYKFQPKEVYYESRALIIPIESTFKGGHQGQASLTSLTEGTKPFTSASSEKFKVFLQSYQLSRRVFLKLREDLLSSFYSGLWDRNTKTWKQTSAIPQEESMVSILKSKMT